MSKNQAMLFLFGGFVGAVLLTIGSFSMGWVVTSGLANATTKEMSEQAVIDQLVPICLHQSRNEADNAGKIDALRGLEQWKREDFVNDQGWATMPGSDSPAAGVGRECGKRLVEAVS